MKKAIKINDIIESFDEKIENLIKAEISGSEGQIKVGYDNTKCNRLVNNISSQIESINELVNQYQLILKGKEASTQLIDEILTLPFGNGDHVSIELKKRFLEWNNIQIPNFPNFKMSAMIDAYDFPLETLAAIETIEALPKIDKAFEFKKYYDQEAGKLVLTEKQEAELKETHALYITASQLLELFCLNLVCTGLNNLVKEPYSLDLLPEMDWRIFDKIKKLDYEQIIVVDVPKVEKAFGIAEVGSPIIVRKTNHI